jgi:hypothetical protein
MPPAGHPSPAPLQGTTERSRPVATPARIRQTVTFLLAGTGLHVAETDEDLVITNPARPDRGLVLVNLTTGAVFWQYQHTERYGHLEGTTSHNPSLAGQNRPVPVLMIIHLLTAIAGTT